MQEQEQVCDLITKIFNNNGFDVSDFKFINLEHTRYVDFFLNLTSGQVPITIDRSHLETKIYEFDIELKNRDNKYGSAFVFDEKLYFSMLEIYDYTQKQYPEDYDDEPLTYRIRRPNSQLPFTDEEYDMPYATMLIEIMAILNKPTMSKSPRNV